MKKRNFFLLFLLFFLTSCQISSKITNENSSFCDSVDKNLITAYLKINEQVLIMKLFQNETTKALINTLPLFMEMHDLNNNEKYFNLKSPLPTKQEYIGNINRGDFMLYGNNCLVLFYETFSSSYQYTKLGFIENSEELYWVINSNSISAFLSLNNNFNK